MIIRRIFAENLLKYRRLEITDIPASGQIAVAGDNEAGKTAIGETICFALFGRTFSLPQEEIRRVVRWSEFSAWVLLEFTGRDGSQYVIKRKIDNNGRHQASLLQADDDTPVAEGVEKVERAIEETAGFTYRAFVDSFYLAQREMEVPHAKSATVKALIGVDRLERVSAELEVELAEINQKLDALHERIETCSRRVAEVGLDRAHLGRLEAKRDRELEQAAKAEERAAKTSKTAETIGMAARSFGKATENFVRCNTRSTYSEWTSRQENVATGLVAASRASQEIEAESGSWKQAGAAIASFEQGLSEFDKVRDLAGLYRHRLSYLLDEKISDHYEPVAPLPMEETGRRFAEQRAAVLDKIADTQARRRPMFGLSIFVAELALLGWIGWGVLIAAPESTMGQWVTAFLGAGATGAQIICLLVGLISGAGTALLISRYKAANRELERFDMELENIDTAARTAREEMDLIEAIDQAPLPDVLTALEGLQNPLIKSAVTAFSDGPGSVFVRDGALGEKLEHIRQVSVKGLKTLKKGKERLLSQVEESNQKALQHHETAAELDRDIKEERKRWEQVEAFEKELGGLESTAGELRAHQKTRRIACELIEGACRRIYARFHPELRRFVSKILPELTGNRYEHLELEDDLRVRVYCKEKNDFVGLAEISNGTHRQLMLCVRLALSQALIASSSKTKQFIFFDEPFVFFDEQRMARAIDVLGKISPQITQVWLAAQTFSHRDRFAMVIDCETNADELIVAGKATKPARASRRGTHAAA